MISSKTMSTPDSKDVLYITEVEPNDVLLGRGAPIINNEGNVRFRKLVNTRKAEYIASCRHQIKNKIAQEIVSVILSRKGRFLRKVEDPKEAEKLNVPINEESAWIVTDDAVVLQKVKQALREQDSKSGGMPAEVIPQVSPTASCPEVVSGQTIDDVSLSSHIRNSQLANQAMIQLGYLPPQDHTALLDELFGQQMQSHLPYSALSAMLKGSVPNSNQIYPGMNDIPLHMHPSLYSAKRPFEYGADYYTLLRQRSNLMASLQMPQGQHSPFQIPHLGTSPLLAREMLAAANLQQGASFHFSPFDRMGGGMGDIENSSEKYIDTEDRWNNKRQRVSK